LQAIGWTSAETWAKPCHDFGLPLHFCYFFGGLWHLYNGYNGYNQPAGCLADRLLTDLGQPQINPKAQKEREKPIVLLRKEIMNKLVVDLLQQKGLGC